MKRDRKPTKRSVPVFRLTLGALYVALFALAGNVPVLAAIQVAGIPVTLQVFLIAMMGLTLGVRGGLTAYGAVLVLTLCGLPMMAGGRGGAAVLLGPTCGYIDGWVFLLVLLGLYADRGMPRLLHKKLWGMSIHLPVSFAVGLAGLALDYLCGSVALAAVSGRTLAEMPALLLSSLAFLPGDLIKLGLASFFSLCLFAKPAFSRMMRAV